MQKVIAATLIAAASLTATAAIAENPGQFQEQKIAAALGKADAAPVKSTSTGPITAFFGFGADEGDVLNKSTKGKPHNGKDRYGPPRGAFGGPDR